MTRAQMREWLAVLTAAPAVAVALTLAWWTWAPVDVPFEVVHTPEYGAAYRDGSIHVHRTWRVHERTTFRITRDLIRVAEPGAPRLRITLPESTYTQNADYFSETRQFAVPEAVPPGWYDLVVTVTWQANPIRSESRSLPVLRVHITD